MELFKNFLRSFQPRLWPYYIAEVLLLWVVMPWLKLKQVPEIVVVLLASGIIYLLASREIDRINAERR